MKDSERDYHITNLQESAETLIPDSEPLRLVDLAEICRSLGADDLFIEHQTHGLRLQPVKKIGVDSNQIACTCGTRTHKLEFHKCDCMAKRAANL